MPDLASFPKKECKRNADGTAKHNNNRHQDFIAVVPQPHGQNRSLKLTQGCLTAVLSRSATLSVRCCASVGAVKQDKESRNETRYGSRREQVGDYDERMSHCRDAQSLRIVSQ